MHENLNHTEITNSYLRLTISPVEINISSSQAWPAGQINHVALSSSTSSKSGQAHRRSSVESTTRHCQCVHNVCRHIKIILNN